MGDLVAETVRQGPAVAGDQRRRRQGLVVRFDIDPAYALTEQQTLDPVDVGCPLAHQSVAFPMTAAKILFRDARDHHHGVDMALAAAPGDQRVLPPYNWSTWFGIFNDDVDVFGWQRSDIPTRMY